MSQWDDSIGFYEGWYSNGDEYDDWSPEDEDDWEEYYDRYGDGACYLRQLQEDYLDYEAGLEHEEEPSTYH